MSEKIIVTSALPYANGPIHFGHVVGAYLPADIYVRYRRMCGDDVHYICGSDEHGVAITLKAEQAGQSYEEYVDHWFGEITRILGDVGIEFDLFSGTAAHRNPHHVELAQTFFRDLHANGYLEQRSEEQFFSEQTQRFLPDRYVKGTCYLCDFDGARGDECPSCGSWLDAKKLKNPRSTLDDSPPVLKSTTHWYLQLDKIRDEWLEQWFESKQVEWKVNVRHFVKGALKDLRERPITRDLPWGVPLPDEHAEDGKVLYVWFEAPIGYLSISKQYWTEQGQPEQFEKLWKDPDTRLYHFIGKDNITFHVVVFPSMLFGAKAGWVMPENVPANEFFNLEGRKFNTSKGWFIPEASIKGRFPVDSVRYALTTMMPETADSDWSWREFQSRLNDDLADNIGNFVSRTLRFAERFLDGEIPDLGELTAEDQEILSAGDTAATEIGEHFAAFSFRKACLRLMAYGNAVNKYYDQQQPWVTRKSDSVRCGHTLRVCAESIRTIAILCRPIMPEISDTILEALGVAGQPLLSSAGGVGLPAGPLRAKTLPVLFPKVPDQIIETELQNLATMAERHNEVTPDPEPTTSPGEDGSSKTGIEPTIDFEQFTAVDMRAATITKAEKHPNADRLLVLEVDLGFETRTILAGVAGSYDPADLVDRRVVAVCNLAPRKMRGIESEGMLLATEDEGGKPRFLAPDPGTPNGARVT
ncbi:MAG: methionine--tRNA ligase [Planctomycetota bacterium]|nr:methionine--tRNA ligase [Planctomycetota bacterium]